MKVSEIELTNFVEVIPLETIQYVTQKNINNLNSQELCGLTVVKKNIKLIRILNSIAKRTIDVLGGIVGTLLLIPLTIIVTIANWIHGDFDPVFYTQERIGKDGRLFKMYKYRTMVIGADEKLKKYLSENEEARKEYKTYKKLKNDPRVTRMGNFLRKTSLDEFPQFINILKGEMSLVGPRPYLPREKEDMGTYYNLIVRHKPGLTGLWQISGRSNVTFQDRLDFDEMYNENNCVKEDIKIIFETIMHVVKKEGAI